MEGFRRHTEKMALAQSYSNSSKNIKMIVTGKNGENFLKYFIDTTVQVEER